MIVALVLWVMVLSFVAFILNPRKVKNPHFHPLQVQVGIHQERNLGSTIVTVLDCHTDPRLVTALVEDPTCFSKVLVEDQQGHREVISLTDCYPVGWDKDFRTGGHPMFDRLPRELDINACKTIADRDFMKLRIRCFARAQKDKRETYLRAFRENIRKHFFKETLGEEI